MPPIKKVCIDARFKTGMAIVKRQSVLAKCIFKLFKGLVSIEIEKSNKLR